MTLRTGSVTTYNQSSTLQMRSVRELIDLIEFRDAPLLKLLGLNNEKKFRLRDFPRIKYEWFDDAMPSRATTLAEAIDADETDTIAVTDGTIFVVGHVVRVSGTETMLITAVSGNDITVTRDADLDADTNKTHLNGATIEIIGVARLENSDYVIHPTTDVDNFYNYTQIFDASVAVSRSEMKDNKYGISDTMAYNMSKYLSDGKRAGQLPILLQKTFYHGTRFAGSATRPRMMGGFNQFVTTNLYPQSGAALDLPALETAMQACWDRGGKPNTLIGNSWAKRKFSEWFKGTIRTERDETKGGAVFDTVVTDFGEIKFVHDWLCPTDTVYLIDPEKMGWIEFEPFSVTDLPVTIDGMIKRIVGEYGFVLLNEEVHAKISGFSTTI